MSQSLIPHSNLLNLDSQQSLQYMPSKAFYIDFENKKIIGMTDTKKAMEQSIYLMLKTGRYEHLIFSWNYGEEIHKLVGKPKDLAKVELTRLLKECLLVDDRLLAIEDIVITDIEEGLHVAFIAVTIHGDIPIESEVKI